MIPQAAVEAAAAAIESRMHYNTTLGDLARAVLEAAEPLILAAAVSEARVNHDHIREGGDGYSAGFHYALTAISGGES
jgi:hypothetical protein